MNQQQLDRMHTGKGFIAALDQSGGSTPKALALYGVSESSYHSEDEMYALIHEMRTRVMVSPAFDGRYILGAILFKNTMNNTVQGMPTSQYLWEKKGIVPFLKVDEGLAAAQDGVQLMKPMPHLDALLDQAVAQKMFGTKMRSVIHGANPAGIKRIAAQQFEFGERIMRRGLVPILEPEVDIYSPEKAEAEAILKKEIVKTLAAMDQTKRLMFKFSIPTQPDFYTDLMADPRVVRVVALSGGYAQSEADELLKQNHGLIASFSRGLLQGLTAQQTDAQFDAMIAASVQSIYAASVT